MRKINVRVLTFEESFNRVCNEITCLNFRFPGRLLLVSRRWYSRLVDYGLLDDCCFNMHVSKFKFNPLKPELL